MKNWLSTYGAGIDTPNDFVILMMYELEIKESSLVWAPVKTATTRDMIPDSAESSPTSVYGTTPNALPNVRYPYPVTLLSETIDSIFNPAILYPLAPFALAPGKDDVSVADAVQRWVAVIMSDIPWTFFETDINTQKMTTPVQQLGALKTVSEADFDILWNYTVAIIPTMRQVLQLSTGFTLR